MGSDLNPDKEARIYVHINNPFTYAGQMLEGCVYINCLSDRPYNRLDLRLLGKQKIMWSERHGNHHHHIYSNEKQTYEERVVLRNFGGLIQSGKQAFPFSILLPGAMPSSYYQDGSNCIKYRLFAELIPAISEATMQSYKKIIDIRESPRINPGPLGLKIPANQQCCCNCCSCECCIYGTVDMRLDCDKNVFSFGDRLKIRGYIDNIMGKVDIKKYEIILMQTITKVQQYGKVWKWSSDIGSLAIYDKQVPTGSKEEINGQIVIPNELNKNYTAIGAIFSRSYFLKLVGFTSCCISNVIAPLHIIVTTPVAAHEELDKPPKQDSSGYYMNQPQAFTNLRPYFYEPAAGIEVFNQVGAPVQIPPNQNQFPPMTKMNRTNNELNQY